MYDIEKLILKITDAVEVSRYTTYEKIANESGISVVQLWKICNGKSGTTLKTAEKLTKALKKLKKCKKRLDD